MIYARMIPSWFYIPADKGNAMVVLDRSMHDHKMKEILNNENTYHKLSRDPTTHIEKKISGVIEMSTDVGASQTS